MTSEALALATNYHQVSPDVFTPAVIGLFIGLMMTTKEAAHYIQNKLGIPFGVRKLCYGREGACPAPPARWINGGFVYFKHEVDDWAREHYPERMLLNPWRED